MIRFIVQRQVEGKNWEGYRKYRNSPKTYTLTKEEAFAYAATLPTTVNVWQEGMSCDTGSPMRVRVPVAVTYRVISSTKVDGIVNQAVVTL
jgi:hypothetical protein